MSKSPMVAKSLRDKAYKLGAEAYKANKPLSPTGDVELAEMLVGKRSGDVRDIIQAWVSGYNAQKLFNPITP